jgi:NADPH:quinone reductase-like Zn-dependent oxidoreductase
MSLPQTQKKWVIRGTKNELDELDFTDGPISSVGDHDVLVRLHAAAINYRDLMIVRVSGQTSVGEQLILTATYRATTRTH